MILKGLHSIATDSPPTDKHSLFPGMFAVSIIVNFCFKFLQTRSKKIL